MTISKKTIWILSGITTLATSIGAFFVFKKKKQPYALPDKDMRNSTEVDVKESVNADTDPAEKGLTQLDSAFRDEWQGMGYPQTHREKE